MTARHLRAALLLATAVPLTAATAAEITAFLTRNTSTPETA
ncbi:MULTISPECIES: hypothetical protein [unclassified Streptomyces]